MIYCKNCGKALKDGTRFCDRCGQSVRRSQHSESSAKARQLEELQRERMRRQRMKQAQERKEERIESLKKKKKQEQRQRRRKNRLVLITVVAILLFTAIIAAISFTVTTMSSDDAPWKTQDGSVNLNATAIPTMQPDNTAVPATPAPSISVAKENNDNTDGDGYRVCSLSIGIDCPYPPGFAKNDTEEGQELNIVDSSGGATMKIYTQEYPGGTPSSLMKEYARKAGGTVDYSLAGSTWYAITIKEDGIIRHRKYVIHEESDSVAYYDFEYDENSSSAADYEKYIDYIDDNFSA
jgi:TolA-binding protein